MVIIKDQLRSIPWLRKSQIRDMTAAGTNQIGLNTHKPLKDPRKEQVEHPALVDALSTLLIGHDLPSPVTGQKHACRVPQTGNCQNGARAK